MLPNFKQNMAIMSSAVEDFPWQDAYAYAHYLSQTYFYVVHSTRLLAFSAGIMKVGDNPFHKRFLEHAAEEKGHDIMILNDLKALGFSLDDFSELPETRMFWEPQYYKIQHNDPLSLMGYIIALETIACEQCPTIKKELEKVHPRGSTTFVRVHAEDDPHHVEKAWQLINSLPPERRKWIQDNFEQTVIGYQNIGKAIGVRLQDKKLLKVG